MTRIERYEELRAAGDDGAVRRWVAWDPLGGAEVSLSTTSVADRNADAIARLRAEARRIGALGHEVRVFEDLEQGLLGVAYRARSRPSPTRVEAPPPPHGPPPPELAASIGTATDARRSRAWTWALVLFALSTAGAMAVWLTQRGASDGSGDAEEEDPRIDEPVTPLRARPSARALVDSAPPVRTVEPPPPGPTCDGLAISTGCIDLSPVQAADARACPSCPSPGDGDDVIVFDHSLDSPIRKELESCRARDGRPTHGGPASCVRYAFAASYCASRGKRVPSEAEWKEGFSNGMTTDPALYEWTRDVVRERMNWTRGARGGSQADRNIRAPSLGFRCVQ